MTQDLSRSFTNQSAAQTPPPIKAVIRFSAPDDLPRVMAYFKGLPHLDTAHRRDDIWTDSCNEGKVFLITDDQGEILGASCAMNYYMDGDAPGYPQFQEIGTTNFPGRYGGYPFIIAAQVLHGLMQHPACNYIANVYQSNESSVNFLLEHKVGWSPFDAPEILQKMYKASKPNDPNVNKPVNWFHVEAKSLPHQARVVLKFLDLADANGIISMQPKDAGFAPIALDITQFPLAAQLRPVLDELAFGALGKYLESAGGTATVQEAYNEIQKLLRTVGTAPKLALT